MISFSFYFAFFKDDKRLRKSRAPKDISLDAGSRERRKLTEFSTQCLVLTATREAFFLRLQESNAKWRAKTRVYCLRRPLLPPNSRLIRAVARATNPGFTPSDYQNPPALRGRRKYVNSLRGEEKRAQIMWRKAKNSFDMRCALRPRTLFSLRSSPKKGKTLNATLLTQHVKHRARALPCHLYEIIILTSVIFGITSTSELRPSPSCGGGWKAFPRSSSSTSA